MNKKSLGHSVSLTEYRRSGELSEALRAPGDSPVFLSLHIREEQDENYVQDMKRLCHILQDSGKRILADVSDESLEMFSVASFEELRDMLSLWALRIDYGVGINEICSLAEKMPVVLNASTTGDEDAQRIMAKGKEVYAMHNFYPRPETGLDEEYFHACNERLRKYGMKIMAFIPGDKVKRMPLRKGLPTLEKHRDQPPYVSFVDLSESGEVDQIFAGDPELSGKQEQMIQRYCDTGILAIPCTLNPDMACLYDQVFTCRIDTPSCLIRVQESRAFFKGKKILSENNQRRERGSITIDNENYLRYQGEVQIMRKDFPADENVNVIGHVQKEYMNLIDLVKRGGKFVFVHE